MEVCGSLKCCEMLRAQSTRNNFGGHVIFGDSGWQPATLSFVAEIISLPEHWCWITESFSPLHVLPAPPLPRAAFLPKSVSFQCHQTVATAPDITNNPWKKSVVGSQDSELPIPCSYLHFPILSDSWNPSLSLPLTLQYFTVFIVSHLKCILEGGKLSQEGDDWSESQNSGFEPWVIQSKLLNFGWKLWNSAQLCQMLTVYSASSQFAFFSLYFYEKEANGHQVVTMGKSLI